MVTMVTDRTEADVQRAKLLHDKVNAGTASASEVTEWNNGLKGIMYHTDMNRLGNAINFIKTTLAAIGFTVNLNPKTNWTVNDYPTTAFDNQFMADINTISGIDFHNGESYTTAFSTFNRVDYAKVNSLEQFLADIQSEADRAFSLDGYLLTKSVSGNETWAHWIASSANTVGAVADSGKVKIGSSYVNYNGSPVSTSANIGAYEYDYGFIATIAVQANPNVTLTLSGAGTGTGAANSVGRYDFTVKAAGSYTVTSSNGKTATVNVSATGATYAVDCVLVSTANIALTNNNANAIAGSITKPSGNYTGLVVRYKEGSYPTSVTDGNNAYNGTGTSFNVTGLSSATNYYFSYWAYLTVNGRTFYSAVGHATKIARGVGAINLSASSIELAITKTGTITVSGVGGALSVAISPNIGTVSVSGNTITIKANNIGEATITVSRAANDSYLAAQSKTITLNATALVIVKQFAFAEGYNENYLAKDDSSHASGDIDFIRGSYGYMVSTEGSGGTMTASVPINVTGISKIVVRGRKEIGSTGGSYVGVSQTIKSGPITATRQALTNGTTNIDHEIDVSGYTGNYYLAWQMGQTSNGGRFTINEVRLE